MQTIKFASMRAGNDPDRDTVDNGIYYGGNVPGPYRKYAKGTMTRTNRGAFRRRVSK